MGRAGYSGAASSRPIFCIPHGLPSCEWDSRSRQHQAASLATGGIIPHIGLQMYFQSNLKRDSRLSRPGKCISLGCGTANVLQLALLLIVAGGFSQAQVQNFPITTFGPAAQIINGRFSGSALCCMAAGPDRNIWLIEWSNSNSLIRIGRFTPQGTYAAYTIPFTLVGAAGADFAASSLIPGPDGALWFTTRQSVGRVTTSGSVTLYSVPGAMTNLNATTADNIVVASDGALWFPGYTGSGPSAGLKTGSYIGRVTTAGVFKTYPVQPSFPSCHSGDTVPSFQVASGPDGAIWFPLYKKLGRITTNGDITYFPVPDLLGSWIASGPDGAVWFTTASAAFVASGPCPNAVVCGTDETGCFGNLTRMTPDGKVTEYPITDDDQNECSFSNPVLGPDKAFYFRTSAFSNGSYSIPGICRVSISNTPVWHRWGFLNVHTAGLQGYGLYPATFSSDGALWLSDIGSIDRVQLTPPVINTSSLPPAFPGTLYSQIVAGAATFAPFVWTANNAPSWLTLDNSKGTLSGTPPKAGQFSFSVTATDSLGLATTQNLTLLVGTIPDIATRSLPSGTLGVAYSAALTASGGTSPYAKWSVVNGTLPPGLALDPNSGTISGMPTTTTGSPFSFGIQVSDANSLTSAIQSFSLAVNFPTGYTAAPAILLNGIVSAAGLQPSLRSGSWATIFGSSLSATTRDWAASDFSGNGFPTSLDGVSVSVAGKPGFIRSIAPSQINFQVPDGLGTGQANVTVKNAAGTSSAGSATTANYAPAFFIGASANSRNYVAATEMLPQGTVYIGPAGTSGLRPAAPGDILTLWATGFGPTQPDVPAGMVFNSSASLTDSVQILIDDVPVTPQFAGLSGAGLYQFNIVVPEIPAGDHRLKATIAGTSTPDGIWLTTQ